MKVMFTVQGEGRGHMTQAIALKQMLEKHGSTVTSVISGGNPTRKLPSFFEEAFQVPVTRIASPGFAQKKNRGISLPATISSVVAALPDLRKSLVKIREIICQAEPDLIINFLEPMMGFYNLFYPHKIPVLSVGHQFMQAHPGYIKVKEFPLQQIGNRQYVAMTGARSHHLALSFYAAADFKKTTVSPPILRPQLAGLTSTNGDYLLIYLVFHGFANDIISWSAANPTIPIHCFCDRPGAPEEERISPALTFHRVHGEKFLKMMADCRAVVSTAGFEAISEAAYLGKPALVVPVENHLEQFMNATEVEACGLGIKDSGFNLSRLLDHAPRPALAEFKSWVDQSEQITMRAIDRCIASRRGRAASVVTRPVPAG